MYLGILILQARTKHTSLIHFLLTPVIRKSYQGNFMLLEVYLVSVGVMKESRA